MNTKLSMKINLLNYIKSFSMPDYPELKILSKTFFNDLFLKLYKNDKQYSLLYGDIDGLRKLNDSIGFDKADLAIEELLKTVLNYLPENVISARMGGDEFCFIIPDFSTSETRKITKQIHTSLASNKSVNGLDITFGACDSTKFDNINDMYNFVENKVNMKKHSHFKLNEDVKDIEDYNKKLDDFIDSSIKEYIKNFRFSSKRHFRPNDLKTLSYPIINTITNLLNDTNPNEYILNNNNDDDKKSVLNDNKLNINYDTTKKIYNLIMGNTTDYEELDSLSINDLKSVRNDLATDSITNAHNNVYRDHYLLPRFEEDEIPFKVILMESLGIKILNSVSSHVDTDLKMKSTFDSLINEFNNVIPKDSNIKLFPIHSGGGTFEVIVQNDISDVITPEVVDTVLDKVNSDKNNIQLFGTVADCFDVSDYNDIYTDLNKVCEEKKNTIKESNNYFISPDALKLIDTSLSSVVNFFKIQSKKLGIYNEHSKKEFSKKIVNSLIDNFHELNLSNDVYEKDSSDYSR